MTKLIIFDLDGTLLDTVEDLGNAANYALRTCGFPEREIEEYKILCGRGIANLLNDSLPEEARTDDNRARMASLFFPYYRAHINDFTRPYEGIPELLDTLSAEGIKFALASNKYQEGAERLIDRFFAKYGFVSILGQREGQPIKPDPAIVGQILAENPDIKADEVVYVGDSNVDMMTGNNAGVRTVGVTWGFRSREELAAHNPWKLIDRPEELAEAVLGSFADRVERIVRRASSIMREKNFEIHTKGGDVANLCTSADIGVQHFLYKELSRLMPGSGFLGEEEDMTDLNHEYVWIIDPIDGTANFARGIAECANSVALKHDDHIELGIVYNAFREELFRAEKGKGAYLNGKRIHVSDRSFKASLFCCALCVYKKEYAQICNDIIMEVYPHCSDVRRFGSAALELCYLANGTIELFFEYRLMPWDYAAASLIVEEAGGVLTGRGGSKLIYDRPLLVVGANTRENHDKLCSIVTSHTSENPYD